MRLPARWIWVWVRSQAWLIPVAILLALWIPGCDQGWLRTDSHKYTALALNAWTNGPLWAPQLGEQPYFNKPPLAFWIVGSVLQFTGPQVWAVRLMSLLAAIGTTVLTVNLVRRLSGWHVGILTGAVVATTIEFFRYTRAFSLDLWLTLFIVASVWCVVTGAAKNRARWVLAAAVPIACALMVKPFTVLFPMALAGVWLVMIGKPRFIPALAGACAMGIALAAPWHIAMIRHFGEPFTSTYFGSQTVERLEGTLSAQDANPWWYYLAQLPKTYLPWIATMILGLVAGIRGKLGNRDRALFVLAAIWVFGWMIVTSCIGDRRTRYLIPIYPLAAALSGLWLARCIPMSIHRRWRVMAYATAPVALVVSAVIALLPITIHKDGDEKWPALVEELNTTDAWAHAWCSPAAYTNASNTFLRAGRWLHLAGPDDHGFGGAPPIGALVLMFEKELTGDRADLGPVVWSKKDLRLVRLERPWPTTAP